MSPFSLTFLIVYIAPLRAFSLSVCFPPQSGCFVTPRFVSRYSFSFKSGGAFCTILCNQSFLAFSELALALSNQRSITNLIDSVHLELFQHNLLAVFTQLFDRKVFGFPVEILFQNAIPAAPAGLVRCVGVECCLTHHLVCHWHANHVISHTTIVVVTPPVNSGPVRA